MYFYYTSICNEVMAYYNGDERERDTDTTLLCEIATHLHAKVHQWRTHFAGSAKYTSNGDMQYVVNRRGNI